MPATNDRSFQRMIAEMKPLFWDTDADALNQQENAPYIISRLLNMGGMAGYCWVKDLYTAQDIVSAAVHRRDFRPQVRSFIAEQYHIPREQLSASLGWR